MTVFHRIGMIGIAATMLLLGACADPLRRDEEQALRERLIGMNRAYIEAMAPAQVIEVSQSATNGIGDLNVERLDEISGPSSYADTPLNLAPDLRGQAMSDRVAIGLQHAIALAVEHNLETELARLIPAINDAQITQAEAVFDAVYFLNTDVSYTDQPRPSSTFAGFGSTQGEDWSLSSGIRKFLSTGGQVTASTTLSFTDEVPSVFEDPSYYSANVALTLEQPLLRGFGDRVNRAQIELARNAKLQAVEDLRLQLLNTIFQVEQAYWNLVFARAELRIRQRLLDQTQTDYQTLEPRKDFDVTPATLSDVAARVESRTLDVIRADQNVRVASDQLKRLLNSPDIPLAGETLIVPLEEPVDAPITFNILDAVTTAFRFRPEMISSLSRIDDASIRQRVADNNRLPLLNLAATLRYNGIGDDAGEAYDNMTDLHFIDYLLSLQFEAPIGNRRFEAEYAQRRLERRASVINYQRTAQDVTIEVKEALYSVRTAYELIGAARTTRRAAAENLRAINVEEEAGVALTPEFIDLKLRRQDALAQAESEEINALTSYNIAVARFHQTTGTLLERNQIEFVPTPSAP